MEETIKMKATGIVRRIDDLGRVVIPKEIRKTLRLREGTPLEIFTDREGEIIFKKYSPMAELGAFSKQYAEALSYSLGHIVCITDRDQIISVAGSQKKELLGKQISKVLEQKINNRESVYYPNVDKEKIPLYLGEESSYTTMIMQPIISEGDAIGSVIICSKEEKAKFSPVEEKAVSCAVAFLGRQMEG